LDALLKRLNFGLLGIHNKLTQNAQKEKKHRIIDCDGILMIETTEVRGTWMYIGGACVY
jgi:hypothetical protein